MKAADPAHSYTIQIIRSPKRKKTVSAELQQNKLIVRAPADMSDETLQPIIAKLQQRLRRQASKQQAPTSDADLEKLAQRLNEQYFHGRLQWQSIRYVTNQKKRYGSCTPSQGTLRISQQLAQMPRWVLEYVLVHELAHLLEANHGPRFWKLVNHYPLTERARGYLMAVSLEEDAA